MELLSELLNLMDDLWETRFKSGVHPDIFPSPLLYSACWSPPWMFSCICGFSAVLQLLFLSIDKGVSSPVVAEEIIAPLLKIVTRYLCWACGKSEEFVATQDPESLLAVDTSEVKDREKLPGSET